ncbi:prolyl oligopeptidase family serine peptidase [Allonocardiopsis opalescens]|uniref:Dipeptidyl aminopeptidase/acylaminoacyl peptidase n=1 Tax=Allonocardiopsis opalescens TaxID=1144618 RepID=A0A2T0Q9L3_9ACTN|nr:prolyl oligopeptidase family serine peptidase [Allonocardiopsis opalescens]PRY00527.1 dipeptidyl aminopeptidase/acylaminoacyl peptidase [Allonocardiopsis opalescens]
MPEPAPYGGWTSPIGARDAAGHGGRPGWPTAAGGELWWTEPRPLEGGRVALVRRRSDGTAADALPAPWNARSRVHEYGGRPFALVGGGAGAGGPSVVFSEFTDQRLYRWEPDGGGEPYPITPEPAAPAGLRYVDPVPVPGGRELWCVRERFTGPAPTDVRRSIVAVPLDGSAAERGDAIRVLVEGHHFLACPRPSPDGTTLAWIGWDHPDMPWDSTELLVAPIAADGTVGPARAVAGGAGEAVVQAGWTADGRLLAVTDPGGWWNLYQVQPDEGPRAAVNLCPREEEFGGPMWQLGMEWFAPLPDGRVAVLHGTSSVRLSLLDPGTGELVPGAAPHTEWAPALAVAADGGVVGVAASPERSYQVVAVDASGRSWTPLTGAEGYGPDPADPLAPYLPRPRARTFAGEGGREVHASVYPPYNPDFTGPPGAPAPYVVFAHGGPTSRAPMVRDLEIAYFTSRGIGVAEVNYGGSTGHGRAYRERLRENWGLVDVADCAAVARALVEQGAADPARLAIRGGSAGGWTAAAALTSVDVFACGTILYPILDLAGWRTGETHDFESQYLESLVGPWPAARERYRERSPINRAERLSAPFVLMQGLEDVICPPVQSERFLERLRGRGVPHAYLAFPGEQHGFRRAETVAAALEAELGLYARVMGFSPPGVPPLELVQS